MVTWAKENAASSGLSDKPIRWIVDDCVKFVEREIRRGNHYDAIIMDPPSYGRGPKGDVGRLFENVSDLQITKEAFRKIAVVELSYRSFGTDIGQVFNDIHQTALCISTRGKAGEGDFDLIQDGIIRVKSFMYKQRYLIDHAIIDAARAAYLATLIEKGINEIESYSNNPADIKDMVIRPSLPNKLNKLRSNLPEAYYYWAKTSELLEA